MILFIYAKDGNIKALDYDDAKWQHRSLIKQGYKHTATIDPAKFLEYIVEYTDEEIVKEIRNLSRTLNKNNNGRNS